MNEPINLEAPGLALLLIVLRNYLLHVFRNEMLRREPTSQCFLGPESLSLSAPLILQFCILLRESQRAAWRREAASAVEVC